MWLSLLLACDFLPEEDTSAACDPRIPYWVDADDDHVGDAATLYLGCEQPSGYATTSGDCDDADPTVTTGCDTGGDTSSDTADSSAG